MPVVHKRDGTYQHADRVVDNGGEHVQIVYSGVVTYVRKSDIVKIDGTVYNHS